MRLAHVGWNLNRSKGALKGNPIDRITQIPLRHARRHLRCASLILEGSCSTDMASLTRSFCHINAPTWLQALVTWLGSPFFQFAAISTLIFNIALSMWDYYLTY
ncbi:hypothetical protein TIFTF001_030128 [Ficus carica]|uniref:Uncharacterized protein n=1 Tax=Ficus carica TaxID=3494 RepID=A0AA88DT69_FICCA|nr:hypothetical protein TIFTF001_030128 [Ficus carica]